MTGFISTLQHSLWNRETSRSRSWISSTVKCREEANIMNPAAILNSPNDPIKPTDTLSRRESKEDGAEGFKGNRSPSLLGFSNNLNWSRASKMANALPFHSSSRTFQLFSLLLMGAVRVEMLSWGLRKGVKVLPPSDTGPSSIVKMGKLSKLSKALYSLIAFLKR